MSPMALHGFSGCSSISPRSPRSTASTPFSLVATSPLGASSAAKALNRDRRPPVGALYRMSNSRNIRWSLVPLYVVFAYLVVLRLWFDLAVAPMGDEAYYWMWGQHLSWSYFDHPPLDGWLQGLVAAIFGWSNFRVRLLTWVTLGGTLYVLWLWSKPLAPDDRTGWFWQS